MMRKKIRDEAMRFAFFVFFFLGTVLHAVAVDQKLKDTLGRARQERLAVIGIGDSNQRFGGHGWSRFMAVALEQQFGCWGTGLNWCRQTDEDKQRCGLPPKELSDQAFSWWYVAPSVNERVSWRNGQLHLAPDHPLEPAGPLQFRLVYGTFKESAGSFQPAVRIDQPPWDIIARTAAPLSSAADLPGIISCTVKLPADPTRTQPLMFSVSPVNADIKGPFFGVCLEAENTAKTTGLAYHTLYAAGGQSLYKMLSTIREGNTASFFQQVRVPLNGDKRCVIIINSGFNDRHEPAKSIGPAGGFAGNSPEAYRDNLEGLTIYLEQAWVEAGGQRETIHFAFMPSHPLATPDDPALVAYREAAVALAVKLPNASCILLPELVSQRDMQAKRYYDQGQPSSPHLSKEGYAALSHAVAAALSN